MLILLYSSANEITVLFSTVLVFALFAVITMLANQVSVIFAWFTLDGDKSRYSLSVGLVLYSHDAYRIFSSGARTQSCDSRQG